MPPASAPAAICTLPGEAGCGYPASLPTSSPSIVEADAVTVAISRSTTWVWVVVGSCPHVREDDQRDEAGREDRSVDQHDEPKCAVPLGVLFAMLFARHLSFSMGNWSIREDRTSETEPRRPRADRMKALAEAHSSPKRTLIMIPENTPAGWREQRLFGQRPIPAAELLEVGDAPPTLRGQHGGGRQDRPHAVGCRAQRVEDDGQRVAADVDALCEVGRSEGSSS